MGANPAVSSVSSAAISRGGPRMGGGSRPPAQPVMMAARSHFGEGAKGGDWSAGVGLGRPGFYSGFPIVAGHGS